MSIPLFHQEAIVATLGSGSRGNCTYVGDGRHGVLVDCGLSTRQIFARLDALGLGGTRIDGVLVTHEHADHIGAARVLDDFLERRQGERVPFHLTAGTQLGANPRCLPRATTTVTSGQPFRVGGGRITVEPFTVPHDTTDPVAYVVQIGAVRTGVITDLGRGTHLVERMLGSLDVAVLEFNHDLEMLLDGPYPWSLKQRVRGPHGHLSNAQSADLVARGATRRLAHLVLAHLSEDNNRPALALEAALEGLHRARRTGVAVRVAEQDTPLAPARVEFALSAGSPPASPVSRPRELPLTAGSPPASPVSRPGEITSARAAAREIPSTPSAPRGRRKDGPRPDDDSARQISLFS